MHLELWCQEVGEWTRKCMMSIWTVRVRELRRDNLSRIEVD